MDCLLLACLPSVAALRAHTQPIPDAANGHALAGRPCAPCHLIGPEAKGPLPDGIPSFMAITTRPGADATRIQASVLSPPHPAMPSPPLDMRQIQDAAAYILTLEP